MTVKNGEKNRGSANVLKAASWYTISNFISKVVLYLYTPIYARILTEIEYGQYGNFTSWQAILVSLFSMNLYSTVANGYIDYNEEKDFNNYISTITILGCVPTSVFFLVTIFFPEYLCRILGMDSFMLLMLALNMNFTSIITVYQAEQRQKGKYILSSFLTLLASVGSAIAIALLLFVFENKLRAIIVGITVWTSAINILILFIILKRSICFNMEYVKYSLLIAVPLIPHVLAGHILGSADKIMITQISGAEFTAYYNLPFTISMIITMLVTSVNNAWVPWFFKKMKSEQYNDVMGVVKITLPLFLTASVCLCIFAPEIVRIVGGEKYANSMHIMPPLILSCFFNYVYTLYVNIEFYHKKTLGISIVSCLSAIVNIGLNYLFIQKFGYIAAAYTTLFSSIVILLMHIILVNKNGWKGIIKNGFVLEMSVLCLVLCIASLLLYSNNIIRWAIESVVLIAFVLVMGVYRKELVSIIKRV